MTPEDDIYILTMDSILGQADADQQRRLAELLRDEANQDIYVDFIVTYVLLSRRSGSSLFVEDMTNGALNQYVLKMLEEEERTAPVIPVVTTPPLTEPARVPRAKITRQGMARFIWRAAAVILLCLGVLWFDRYIMNTGQQRNPVIVGTLVDQVGAEWAEASIKRAPGDMVWSGDYALQKGVVEILFENGARTLIEAPARFELIARDRIQLDRGRLYARVPRPAIGFTVDTSNSRIIDMGTEFGVLVNDGFETELHVLKGSTHLISGTVRQDKKSLVVPAGEARRIASDGGMVNEIPLKQKEFVQYIDSQNEVAWNGQDLDLADLVGGGTGFGSGQVGFEIDMETGRIGQAFDVGTVAAMGFVPCETNAMIDGVFIPDGSDGPVPISSTGLLYDKCPKTNGTGWGNVRNGYWRALNNVEVDGRWSLDGTEYGVAERSAIYMHSNKGITFDLQAIRGRYPFIQLSGFSTRCGLADNAVVAEDEGDALPRASFFVLVDGREVFRRDNCQISDDGDDITIPLTVEDRFLTLMLTNGKDNRTRWDWGLFARPTLQVIPTGERQTP